MKGYGFFMTQVMLENLTPRQRQAYVLRFGRRWRLKEIAAKLGITISSAGELVKRAQLRAGLGRTKVRVIRTQPRATRARSLTNWEHAL